MQITMKEARERAGLELHEAATLLGVGQKTLAKWEAGLSSPRVTQFFKLCMLYCVGANDIIIES